MPGIDGTWGKAPKVNYPGHDNPVPVLTQGRREAEWRGPGPVSFEAWLTAWLVPEAETAIAAEPVIPTTERRQRRLAADQQRPGIFTQARRPKDT